jgi:hypothetical protein
MTPTELLELRSQWGRIYAIEILGTEFVWRPITRKEYKDICALDISDVELEELVCELCVLRPRNYDFSDGYSGIATVLAAVIIDTSCLDNDSIRTLMSIYRDGIDNFDAQMDLVIFEGFRGKYSLEEIRSWTVEKSIAMFVQAEWILRTLRGVPLEIEDEGY